MKNNIVQPSAGTNDYHTGTVFSIHKPTEYSTTKYKHTDRER